MIPDRPDTIGPSIAVLAPQNSRMNGRSVLCGSVVLMAVERADM